VPRTHILSPGYGSGKVASTVSLIEAEGALIVVDPGMVSSRAAILDPLAALGYDPSEVTDVIISHHHPDHTINVALFPEAVLHDHWATYRNDEWNSRPAEGVVVAPGVTLWETPGHTPQDITTIVETEDGVTVFTHLWTSENYPPEDRLATDPEALHRSRARVLEIAEIVVPGHGPAFRVSEETPR